jgi:hypothetical protein
MVLWIKSVDLRIFQVECLVRLTIFDILGTNVSRMVLRIWDFFFGSFKFQHQSNKGNGILGMYFLIEKFKLKLYLKFMVLISINFWYPKYHYKTIDKYYLKKKT